MLNAVASVRIRSVGIIKKIGLSIEKYPHFDKKTILEFSKCSLKFRGQSTTFADLLTYVFVHKYVLV